MSSCGTPYIGSKISLVSKAKIRYEGFLYTIDTEESTVTLAKVKSFGTEDRFVENRVPERNEIYEYIVFRGSDIDDLHVSEGPKSRGGQVAQDPAIVQTGNAQPNMYQPQLPMQMGGHFPHQSYGPFGGIPTFGYPIGFRPPTSMPLSSVIGQGSVNERNHRSSPFEQNYRQSPSPPSNSTSGLRNSHKDHQENRNVSPEVTHTSRERYNNEKISNTQAEAPKPQREQKRSWRHKEAEQPSERNVQKDADQTSVRRQQNRDKDSEPQKSQQPQRQQREHEEKSIGRNRAVVREQILREQQKEQGYARNFKKNQETREVEPSSYGRSNDTSKTRNNLKEKDLPRASTAMPKKDSLEKEVAEQNYSQPSGGIERGRGRGRGTKRGRGRGSFSRTRFDQDFDFESANAKFNKEEVEKELLTSMKKNLSIKEEDDVIVEKETGKTSGINEDDVDVNGDEGYYDKTKSFFDQISCDSAKERPDTMTKRKERSINTETFGMIPRNYRGRPYRARGGRGSRGRGFGRGQHARRGQGGNRAWVDYEFDFEAAGLRQGAAGNKQGGS